MKDFDELMSAVYVTLILLMHRILEVIIIIKTILELL